MPTWDGGTSSFGKRHQPVWPKIAKFCLEHGINHEILIREFFEDRLGGYTPRPTDLMTNEALAVYARAHVLQREDVFVTYKSEQVEARRRYLFTKMMNVGMSDEDAWKTVILAPLSNLSPLFSYCLACSIGALGIAAMYRERAFWQYIASPRLYDEAMGSAIPHDLREETAHVHEATLHQSS